MSDVNSLIADLDSNKAYYDPSASDSPTKKQIAVPKISKNNNKQNHKF